MLIACCLLLIFITAHTQTEDSITIKGIPHKLGWEIKPQKFINKKDSFIIESGAKTDMFRDPNVTYNTDNAPKLLFTPDVNFILIASIKHSFANKWDGGAIVLKADSINWIKFCYEKDYTGNRRVVTVVTKDVSDDCNSVSYTSNKVYFKIAKADNVITLYCSDNGKNWLLVRHLQINFPYTLHLGFLTQSPLGKNCTVSFGDIVYEAKKIADPYKGE